MILGKATWNDAARNYIKSVPNYIEDVEKLFEYAGNGDAEKFKEIVKKNKKYLFARDSQGRTPLHLAAQNGHAAIVKQVISENAEYTQITDPVSNIFNKISLVVEFKRWWVLKSKIFGQKSIYSKETIVF
mgnify:CR=1 FL=1